MITDKANQELLLGDKVVYASYSELSFGIVAKINPQKSLIRETDSEFENFYSSDTKGTPIFNYKLYKVDK